MRRSKRPETTDPKRPEMAQTSNRRARPLRTCNSREAWMRVTGLAILVGAAIGAMTAPAMAAWHGYISHPLGFAFAAPGEVKVETGTYTAPVAGQRKTLTYHFSADGVDYKAII